MAKRFRQSVIVFGAKNGTTIDEEDQEGTNLDCHPIMPMQVDAADCATVSDQLSESETDYTHATMSATLTPRPRVKWVRIEGKLKT